MRRLKVILLTCIMVILMIEISYGAFSNTYEIKMETPNKTEFLTGETIEIPVKIENINIENGIVAFSTLLSYDENVFEELEIVEGTNWGKPNIVEHLIQSTTVTMQPIKEDQEIMVISLKIKENAQLGETKITLSKFEVSDGDNTIVNEGSSIELNITNAKAKVANAIIDNIWFNERNITIAAIISITTLFIIVFITIYYVQHREKKDTSHILYEEVEGISEEVQQNDTEKVVPEETEQDVTKEK